MRILCVGLLTGLLSLMSLWSQQPAQPPAPKTENVYYQSWDSGEIKSCSTYSGEPFLLICDDTKLDWNESFLNLIGKYAAAGSSEDDAYKKAFSFVSAHSKQFLVNFSEKPWPEPRTGRKLAMWDCTKDSAITCKLTGRQ